MTCAKRAEGLSLQVIVIAAIALVVLIVVLAVFKGGIDKILPSLDKVNDCPPADCKKQGECRDGKELYGFGCETKDGKPSDTPYCCKRK